MARRIRSTGLSAPAAAALKPVLDDFLAHWTLPTRLQNDPLELPHRYSDPRDIEVSALLSASLAYGRVDLFKPKLETLLAQMGPSPARFVSRLDVAGAKALLSGFVYRFNVGTDLAVLLLGMGKTLNARGSLEAAFDHFLAQSGSLHGALQGFTATLRDVPLAPLRQALGAERGLSHLLPSPLGGGAAKRLNLFLRWMVRPPTFGLDFGIWTRIPPARLLIPLDTHVHRISRHLGLTRRNDVSWRTAEEVTASLRRLDPSDPVKYDFALCHYGMSGACPQTPVAEHCQRCVLLPTCRVGPKVLKRAERPETRS